MCRSEKANKNCVTMRKALSFAPLLLQLVSRLTPSLSFTSLTARDDRSAFVSRFNYKQPLKSTTTSSSSLAPLPEAIVPEETIQDSIVVVNLQTSPVWKSVAPQMWENPRGVDVTVTWQNGVESPAKVANRLLDNVGRPKMMGDKNDMHHDLVSSITHFVNFCNDHSLATTKPVSFKARLVATRGTASTKCPQWHLDHVPVRWIQAMHGPGVEYVQDASLINWQAVNAMEDDDNLSVEERNALLVTDRQRPCCQASCAMLIGNAWEEMAGYPVEPCVHKSPDGLLPWEGRVLLTMDPIIIMNNNDE